MIRVYEVWYIEEFRMEIDITEGVLSIGDIEYFYELNPAMISGRTLNIKLKFGTLRFEYDNIEIKKNGVTYFRGGIKSENIKTKYKEEYIEITLYDIYSDMLNQKIPMQNGSNTFYYYNNQSLTWENKPQIEFMQMLNEYIFSKNNFQFQLPHPLDYYIGNIKGLTEIEASELLRAVNYIQGTTTVYTGNDLKQIKIKYDNAPKIGYDEDIFVINEDTLLDIEREEGRINIKLPQYQVYKKWYSPTQGYVWEYEFPQSNYEADDIQQDIAVAYREGAGIDYRDWEKTRLYFARKEDLGGALSDYYKVKVNGKVPYDKRITINCSAVNFSSAWCFSAKYSLTDDITEINIGRFYG